MAKKKKAIIKRKNARADLPKGKGNPRRKGMRSVRPKLESAPKRTRAKKPAPRDVGPLDLLSEAMGEIQVLADEMRTWADNMEDKFSGTEKYAQVNEAADALEAMDEPSVEITALNDHKISWQDPTPRSRPYSRADRAGNAVAMLQAVEQKMRDLVDELPPDDAQHDAADALADETQTLSDDLEQVDFPGMY
jgi:hypothetical protein